MQKIKSVIDSLGGRKFILAVLIVLLSAGAFVVDALDGTEWAAIVTIVMGAFTYGNRAEHTNRGVDDDT